MVTLTPDRQERSAAYAHESRPWGFVVDHGAHWLRRTCKDTGQTLGVYGVGPGPYLVLPFLPPLTVRDGIGFGVDAALDPLLYVSPFAASAGRSGGTIVNDRALNLERFESVEEATLDLYSAVRNAYLSRRQQAIADAIAETR
jgi:phospholipid-binding lipoprotein MlaA